MKQLILGGIRSGKSAMAENIVHNAAGTDRQVIYVATAQAHDDEMAMRIHKHTSNRPEHWKTIEEPLYLATAIEEHANTNNIILIDCLTLWITNLLLQEDNIFMQKQLALFTQLLPKTRASLVMVSTETGLGIIPNGSLTRQFCDEAGLLHQQLAKLCDRVILSVAGLPLILKGEPNAV